VYIVDSGIVSIVHSCNMSIADSGNVSIVDRCNVSTVDSGNVYIGDSCNVSIVDSGNVSIVDSCNVSIVDSCDVSILDRLYIVSYDHQLVFDMDKIEHVLCVCMQWLTPSSLFVSIFLSYNNGGNIYMIYIAKSQFGKK
jgi:hypothetical protein